LGRQFIKKRKIIGGLSMKKMLRNKKGFSLIELLIVIAIMGILAVIAFSMFSGIVANSTKKADQEQANNIQKALIAYMVDTGDEGLTSMKADTDWNGTGDANIATGTSTYMDIISALQVKQTVDGDVYEGYLNPKSGTKPSSSDFDVQWSKHIGYQVKVYTSRASAEVVPVTSGGVTTVTITVE